MSENWISLTLFVAKLNEDDVNCGNTNLNEDMIVAVLIPGVTTQTKFGNRTQSNQKHLRWEFD